MKINVVCMCAYRSILHSKYARAASRQRAFSFPCFARQDMYCSMKLLHCPVEKKIDSPTHKLAVGSGAPSWSSGKLPLSGGRGLRVF